MKTDSLLSGIAEGGEECKDPFAGLKEDEEELETTKLPWTTANYECTENCLVNSGLFA